MSDRENKDSITNEETAHKENIGTQLKLARINRNEDLSQVSNNLRIRQVYLEAIENNQFDVLPGDIYVIGFIRSYSEYLGLDTEEIVSHFRNNGNSRKKRDDLIFPAFVPENVIPGSAILLIGLIVVIVGYGGWYFVINQNSFIVKPAIETTSKLTSSNKKMKISPKIPDKKTSSADTLIENEIAKQIKTAKKNKTKKQNNQITPKNQKATEEQEPAEDNKTPVSTKTQQLEPKPEKEEKTIKKEEELVSTEKKKLEPKPEKEEKTIKKEEELSAAITQQSEDKTTIPVSPDLEDKSTLELTQQKKLGETNLKDSKTMPVDGDVPKKITQSEPLVKNQTVLSNSSRISITALTDSYIQVRDNNTSRLLITRLLKKDQRYEVPNRPGLSLITGNAGALKISVDGVLVPSIGPIGKVRRNVILDADKLRKGLAVLE